MPRISGGRVNLPIRHRDIGPVEDGLGHLEVEALGRIRGRPQSIPDLLTAVEGRSGVPELVPLGPQLALGQRDVGAPADGLVAERAVLARRAHGNACRWGDEIND